MAHSQDPMRFGTKGDPVIVKTNAFRFKELPQIHYYHYDAITQLNVKQRGGTTVDKELKAGQRYTEIIDQMHVQHARYFPMRPSYDGLKNLYVPFPLQNATEFRVVVDDRSFLVRLKQVATIDKGIFPLLTSGQGAGANLTAGPQAVAVNLLQVLVSQAPHIRHKFSPHAKSFFLEQARKPLPGGLVALPGFFQSVRPTLGHFIVNVDTTTAAFYPAGPLIEAAMGFLNANSPRDLILRCNNPDSLEKLRRFLFKVAVRIKIPGQRRNAKRYIKRLVPRAGYSTFQKGEQLITVKDHFAEEYNLILQNPDMFGVQFDSEAVYPAELCVIAEGQRYKKKLDPDQTRQFLTMSVRKPHQRITDIVNAVKGTELDYKKSPYMLDAGVAVETTPLEISGRELPAVAVGYGTGQEEKPRDGAWNAMRKTFINPAVINAWAVVSFDDKPGAIGDVRRFSHNLLDNMKKLGMKFYCADPGAAPMPNQIPTPVIEGNQYQVGASLSKVVESMRLPPGRKPNFILVILPMNAAELRKQVKWWGDVMYGVSTQCVRAGKYNRGNDQYCNNVALKINAKADGVSFVPSVLMRKWLDKTMVVGCDVSHPAPGVRDRPSIASVVSSYHFSQSQYNAAIDCQDPRREIIENFAPMMKNAVDVYAAANTVKIKSETDPTKVVQMIRQYPETILVYRDGVSEGEYEQVIEQEIKPLKAMLWEEFKRDIKVVFIVVGKRHHMRFFPRDQSQSDRSGNCRAGLVIDQGVVHSHRTDFYLQSHSGLLGTSRSSHYVVLHNEMNWNADALQEISYVLCHVYAAATRSVSIPAPVYYADRACTRAAFQFRQDGTVPDYESSADPDAAFDLTVWREALMQSKIAHRMYFM